MQTSSLKANFEDGARPTKLPRTDKTDISQVDTAAAVSSSYLLHDAAYTEGCSARL
jgi:hypothetical protein